MPAVPVRILVAIPVYNHGKTLPAVVERVLALHPEVLVVDDGSTDGGTAGLVAPGVRLVRHERNRGKGKAILTAARLAQRLGMTHLVTIDADGQHDPADLPRFFAAIREDPWAIVVGKRDFTQAGIPGASRFGRQFSNFWLRVQTGVSLGDTQSGFRAYPVAVLEALHLYERGFAFEIEVLVKAAWAGITLREIDVAVHYPPPGERVSHFGYFRDNLRLSLLNTRLTLRSMIPFPHRRLAPQTKTGEKITALHPVRSVRALLTESARPQELAVAGALGILVGTLPFIGFHTLLVLAAAGYFRLNRLAALGTNQICMPPLVPALCIEVGYFIRHGAWLTEVSMRTLWDEAFQRIWEWLLGSLVLGPLLALAVGGTIWLLAHAVQRGTRGGDRP